MLGLFQKEDKVGIDEQIKHTINAIRLATEEKENALREAKENLQLFYDSWDSVPFVVYITEMDTYEIIFMNKYAKEKFGEGIGKKCYEVFQGYKKQCDFCTNDRLLMLKEHYKWKFKAKDGTVYNIIDVKIMKTNGKARPVRLEVAIPEGTFENAEMKYYE